MTLGLVIDHIPNRDDFWRAIHELRNDPNLAAHFAPNGEGGWRVVVQTVVPVVMTSFGHGQDAHYELDQPADPVDWLRIIDLLMGTTEKETT